LFYSHIIPAKAGIQKLHER